MQETEIISNKKNFDFVDTIRCISMIGIVFEHTEVFGTPQYESFFTSLLQVSFIQFFKFSTIAFFLIAGFLINHKFTEYTPWQYLKNRFKNTIGPWAFWLNIFILINVINLLFIAYFKYNGERHMPSPFIDYLLSTYYKIIVDTSFWFILNFLICIAILLAFKRFIYSKVFGAVLGIFTLFYSINLYHGWIITRHTTALFGFVFFLWLGAYMNKHSDMLFGFIRKTSISWLVSITVVLFFVSDLETIYLKTIGSQDPYNTLHFTNILYSLSFFLVLIKIGSIPSVNKIFQPRVTTFGIYLIHPIIIQHLLNELFHPLHWYLQSLTLAEAIGYSILRFLVTYGITFMIVSGLSKGKLSWSIGR
ncbi:acyltransferase [Pedobacter sp. MC2016-15]|uniref:acyltransferase family protein n=1 Tax=Pedobacter sp. MC2016-15 TaxID=2994473 RepID=UPI002247A72F|nr:acyltransferase [Pedobacter sp. MC2016-15]MCX2478649.1 acyltransferase [Pedobacter sp. MC2016-15]